MRKTYFHGDKVVYTGEKQGDIRNKVGEVIARVANSTSVVVEFGDDSYVMSPIFLKPWKPSKEPAAPAPEVQVKRKRVDPDLE